MERVLPLFNGRHFGDELMIALLPHVYSVARRMLELGMNSRRHFDVIDVACLLSLNHLQLETAKELYTMRTDNLEKSRDGSNIPQEHYLRCYFGLARIFMFLGDLLSAERSIELGLQGRSFDQMTDDEIVTYWEGIFLLAHSGLCQGHFDKAERLLLMIVGAQDRLPTTDLFYVLTSLGDMYNSLAEYKKTLEVLNLALSLCLGKRKVVADLHLASCYVSYGYALDRVNKPKEAHVHFTKGLDMLDALLPENDIRLANALHKSGDCLRKLGLISEGCDRSKRALEIAKSVFPPGSMELHKYLTRHARNLSYADKKEESIVCLKETLALLELCGAKETAIATCLDLLGDSLSDIGKTQEAITYLQRSFHLYDKLLVAGKVDTVQVHRLAGRLGDMCLEMKKPLDASRHFRRAFALSKELPVEDSSSQRVAINFVRSFMESKQSSEAEAIIWEVSERYGSQLPSDHPLLQCMNRCFEISVTSKEKAS